MKYFIQGVLWLLMGSFMLMFVFLCIDIDMAERDYQRAKDKGDYEQVIRGCIFDWVCKKYTWELQK